MYENAEGGCMGGSVWCLRVAESARMPKTMIHDEDGIRTACLTATEHFSRPKREVMYLLVGQSERVTKRWSILLMEFRKG
jgi:hypothetical protein